MSYLRPAALILALLLALAACTLGIVPDGAGTGGAMPSCGGDGGVPPIPTVTQTAVDAGQIDAG